MPTYFKLTISAMTPQGQAECLAVIGEAMTIMKSKGFQIKDCAIDSAASTTEKDRGWSPSRQVEATDALFAFFGDKPQAEIAQLLGIAQGSVSKYQRGVGRMSRKVILTILDALQSMKPPAPPSLIEKFCVMIVGGYEATEPKNTATEQNPSDKGGVI